MPENHGPKDKSLSGMREILGLIRSAWGYLKEISGENAYDRYLERHRATHPGKESLGRGEFYRRRQDEKYANPGSRCP